MPCSDWGQAAYEDSKTISGLQKRNDKLARMLCHTLENCSHLQGVEKRLSPETKEWWAEHQVLDAKEREKELLASAIAKLSPEERKAVNKNKGL